MARSPEGAPFAVGFRAAMLVMGSIMFVGVLLAISRRSAAPEVPAETPTPIIAAP